MDKIGIDIGIGIEIGIGIVVDLRNSKRITGYLKLRGSCGLSMWQPYRLHWRGVNSTQGVALG